MKKLIVDYEQSPENRLYRPFRYFWATLYRTPFVKFYPYSQNVSSTTVHFSKSWISYIQCGFIWKETMQLVSGKVEFNACQVSLLWHNSFLVSLWTFQPTLVRANYVGPIVEKCWWRKKRMLFTTLLPNASKHKFKCHFHNDCHGPFGK